MTALLIAATLWGTFPLWEPAHLTCDTLSSARPETRLMAALIRIRPPLGAWRDTLRYHLRTSDRPGQLVPFPYVHTGLPMEYQIALVDSTGNVGCWSNIVRKDP